MYICHVDYLCFFTKVRNIVVFILGLQSRHLLLIFKFFFILDFSCKYYTVPDDHNKPFPAGGKWMIGR